jgi:glycosyltransferase involved in cell wall biosynthesis
VALPKILYVGFDIDPARAGRGGVGVYQQGLARAMRSLGCEVTLFLGTRHTLKRRPRLERRRADGLEWIELVDSPLRHCDHHADPTRELEDPVVEGLTAEVLRDVRPDVVHLHDPRLHPASVVDVALAAGVPVVKTMHNFFDVCPQGELFADGHELCVDDEGGRRCRRCLARLPTVPVLREELSGSLRGSPAHALLGRARRGLARLRARSAPSSSAAPTAPLPHPAALYVARKRARLERLNRLSLVHCYAQHAADELIARGVDATRVRVIHVATPAIDGVRRKPPRDRNGPLTLGYVTGASHSKGFDVLLDALRRLPRDRVRLHAHGFDDPPAMQERHRDLPVVFHGPYAPLRDLNAVLAPVDVGVIPSRCREVLGMAGLEMLAAGIPLVGSCIGGIPEFLTHEENGLLVPPGDPAALAAAVRRLLDEPGLRARLQAGIRPWKRVPEHAQEMLALYNEVVAQTTPTR